MKEDGEEYAEGFEDYFHEEKVEKKNKNNVVIIASRPFEVYNQKILDLGMTHDQIEIQVTDQYLQKAIMIIKMWEPFGLEPQRNKNNPDGRILFQKTEEEILLKDKNKFKGHVNHIWLTKIPEIFRCTKI